MSEMGNYLDSKNITEIQIDDAIRMWVSEKKENYIHENSVGEQVRFEIDEIEEGYSQACENAGIPRILRQRS